MDLGKSFEKAREWTVLRDCDLITNTINFEKQLIRFEAVYEGFKMATKKTPSVNQDFFDAIFIAIKNTSNNIYVFSNLICGLQDGIKQLESRINIIESKIEQIEKTLSPLENKK